MGSGLGGSEAMFGHCFPLDLDDKDVGFSQFFKDLGLIVSLAQGSVFQGFGFGFSPKKEEVD
jgi:hypothetical protein